MDAGQLCATAFGFDVLLFLYRGNHINHRNCYNVKYNNTPAEYMIKTEHQYSIQLETYSSAVVKQYSSVVLWQYGSIKAE